MTVDLLVYLFVSSLAVAYWTRWLLFDPYQSGVFASKTTTVKWLAEDENGTAIEFVRSIDLTDRIRYLFGVYVIDKNFQNEWFAYDQRMKLWLCPYCLAFWLSFLVSWYFFLNLEFDLGIKICLTVILHFALAMLAAKVVLYETR